MSGGHYDYLYHKVSELSDCIFEDCRRYSSEFIDSYGFKHEAIDPDILVHMKFIATKLEALSEAAKDIEWYMSGDYGENTLRTRCESWKLSEAVRKDQQV